MQYGKRLKDITSVDNQDVKSLVVATFEDGTQANGHLLIGADGAKSVVRQRISGLGKGALITLPLMGIRAISTLSEDLSRSLSIYIKAEQVVSIHPVGLIAYISRKYMTNNGVQGIHPPLSLMLMTLFDRKFKTSPTLIVWKHGSGSST